MMHRCPPNWSLIKEMVDETLFFMPDNEIALYMEVLRRNMHTKPAHDVGFQLMIQAGVT